MDFGIQKIKKIFILAVLLSFFATPAVSFSASLSAPLTSNLSSGMTSPQVVYLQDLLKELGFLPVSQGSTGYYGAMTRSAVIAFQKKNKILQTGTVGPLTRTSLISATKLQYSGWIPYWKKTVGTSETIAHMNVFNEISPFSYSVRTDGTLIDTAKMTQDPWPNLIASAKQQKVKIVPSILWTDASSINSVLKDPSLRALQENAIVKLVSDNNFDGIDIDYENKNADTKKYFSAFLKELSALLHKNSKILVCTIEPRTPLDSRFVNIPADIEYANDYSAINSACDEVRLMAYDQMVIDLKLNNEKGSLGTYAPVADPAWVLKVMNLAAQDISLRKIVLGVPTYGYEFKVTPDGKSFDYARINSINPVDAVALAQKVGAIPARNAAGEMSFTYINPADATTTAATSTPQSFRMVWWSDAQAIADKVALAKKLGVKGVVVFKLDGGEDPNLWNVLK